VALTLGFTAARGVAGVALIVVAVVVLGIFYQWEKRVASPVLDVVMLSRNVVFARSGLASLINYSATFSVAFLVSLYLQYIRGLDPRAAGLVLLTQSIVMAVVSPLAGRLSDRLEPRIVASLGMALGVIGLGWLCFLRADTPMGSIIATLVVLGAGFGLFSSPNTNAIMSSVGERDYGVASATVGTMRMLGQMLSMGLAAAVLAIYIGPAAITPELHGRFLAGLRVLFVISSVLCFIGMFASLSRGNVRRGNTQN
jgi:MFS family permease